MSRYRRPSALAAIAMIGASALLAAPSGRVSAAPPAYPASDVIGQTDLLGNPVFTTSGQDNNLPATNATGLFYPHAASVDTVGHRLFVAEEKNNRVLVFTLDASNNLVSRTAAHVLGQPTFVTNAAATTQSGMDHPTSAVLDAVHQRLFVAEDRNNRVLIFDLSAGITDGMNAAHELGQVDFTTNTCFGLPQASFCDPYGGAVYDPVHDRYFVSDGQARRVLMFDLAAGITDGMDASAVLGQSSLTSFTCATDQTHITYPYGLTYDSARQILYVADDGRCVGSPRSRRVMIFDLSGGVTNGMAAAHVLGRADFSVSSVVNPDNRAATDNPEDLALDPARQQLYVSDDNRNRFLVFDVSSVVDGEEAMAVLGKADFVAASTGGACTAATADNVCDPEGLSDSLDTAKHRLYIADSGNNRVLIFNFVLITSSPLGGGSAGAVYSATVTSTNSKGTVSYTVASGALPPGLTLNSSTGQVSGMPTTAGTYVFVVKATDDNGAIGVFTDVQSESVTIAGIPVPPTGGAL